MFEDDEDEKFRQMLGGIIGSGPASYDVTTSMEQPDQTQLSAPYMPQSAGGMYGYTPPPAAGPAAQLDHVQGHQFGAGDLAMLGGIVAALLGGGRHRGEIAGSLAGSYGGAVMQANARADQRNQQIDQFNAVQAAKDDPLARWKADQEAQYRAGSLKARGDELALQKTREERIAAAQAAEDIKDPVEEAKRVAQARADVALDTRRRENDMEVGTREMLGEILGKQRAKYAAPGSAADTPEAKLKRKLAENALAGMESGAVDPLTGKPIVPKDADGNPIKPQTPASKAAADKLAAGLAPFEGTEVADESVWKPIASNPTIREKSRRDDAALSGALPAIDRMIALREQNGAETGFGEDSGKVTAAYDVERGKMESALGVLKNIGVISPTEAANLSKTIPTLDPKFSDVSRLVGAGDSTLGKLKGLRKEWADLVERGRAKYGLRAKTTPTEEPIGDSPDGAIKFSVDTDKKARFDSGEGFGGAPTGKPPASQAAPTDGGKRLVTMHKGDITDTQELTEEQIQKLKLKGWSE
jgi:hypothetical protein